MSTWIDTMINEKGIDTKELLTVNGKGGINYIPVGCVIDAIKSASKNEQTAIKNMMVKIDFANASIVDYLRHLAQAIAI